MMMKRQLNDLEVLAKVENNMLKDLNEQLERFITDYGNIVVFACLIALLLTLILFVYLALNDQIIF